MSRNFLDNTGLFIQSALSSPLELFGFNPSDEVQDWRDDNVLGGLGSEIIGGAVPYLGWAKWGRRLGAIRRADDWFDRAFESQNMVRNALKGITGFAPFEASRVGTSYFVEEGENFDETLNSAAFNLGLEGATAGVLGAVRTAGRRLDDNLPPMPASVNQRDAPHFQLKALRETPDLDERTLNLHSARLTRQIYDQENRRYLPQAWEQGFTKEDQRIERLFSGGGALKLTNERVFGKSLDEMREAVGLAGRDEHVLHPRLNTEKNFKGAEQALRQVNENGWLARDADGLYIVTQRVKDLPYKLRPVSNGVERTVQGTDDLFLTFKTDRPDMFFPEESGFEKFFYERTKQLFGDAAPNPIGVDSFDNTIAFLQNSPLYGHAENNLSENVIGKAIKQLSKMTGEEGNFTRDVARWAKKYLTPSEGQFTNQRARQLWSIVRSVTDSADANARRTMFGTTKITEEDTMILRLAGKLGGNAWEGREPIAPLIESLAESDLADLRSIWGRAISPKGVQRLYNEGRISENLFKFYRAAREQDDHLIGQLQLLHKELGLEVPRSLKNHLMISRTWLGDHRVPVFDERGVFVGMGSGHSIKAAQDRAAQMIEAAAQEGKQWKAGNAYLGGTASEVDTILTGNNAPGLHIAFEPDGLMEYTKNKGIALGAPGTLKEREGLRGFTGDDQPFTRDELMRIMSTHTQRYHSYMANISLDAGLRQEFDLLRLEDQDSYYNLINRVRAVFGEKGVGDRLQNKISDMIFGKVVGKDSATKMVGALNTATFSLQLGLGNPVFPILNAAGTWLQTVLPQVAYVMKAPTGTLARYYDFAAVAGADGVIRHNVGVFSPMKLGIRAWRALGPKGMNDELAEIFARGADEGLWTPRYVEEHVGKNSIQVNSLKEAWDNGGPLGWLQYASEWAPGNSEKIARAHAVATGYLMGKEVLNIQDADRLYGFVREFTNKTMFLYGAQDRAKIITGPLGALAGMFKNWTMNQIMWTAEYTGLAMNHGVTSPLLYMAAGTAGVGGVAAVPGYFAADWIAKQATDQNLMQLIYENFSGDDRDGENDLLADGIYYGLPGFLGQSLQASSEAPGANPIRDANMMFSLVHWRRAQALGQAVGGAFDQALQTGQHPATSPEVRDALARAFAPRSMQRLMQSANDEYVQSLHSGYPSVRYGNASERVLYALGFNPVGIDRNFQAMSELWNSQDRLRGQIATFGMALAAAQEEGDGRQIQSILMRATSQGVPLDSVMRSAQARRAKAEEDGIVRQFELSERERYRDVLAGY